MSKTLDKHKARLETRIAPNADTTLALLFRRAESGENLIVPSTRDGRAALRKIASEAKKEKSSV